MYPLTEMAVPRTIFVALMSLAPFLFVLIQQRSVRRMQGILTDFPKNLQCTQLWQEAQRLLDRRYFLKRSGADSLQASANPRTTPGSFMPMFAYLASLGVVCLIMLSSWSFILEAPLGIAWYVKDPNIFLSGPAPDMASGTLEAFQTNTLAVSGVAFLVAYFVVLNRMLMRLNINEHSSLENLFDALHLTGAIVISTVGRLLLEKSHAGYVSELLFAVGTGLRPDFYLASLGRAAFGFLTNTVGFLAGMRDPARKNLNPNDMPPGIQLEAVDGLTGGVLGRIQRIDIETCQRLAFSNPFVVSSRISWNLHEVVDWIGQALLIIHFPESQKALDVAGVRTIMDLLSRLQGTDTKLDLIEAKTDDQTLRQQLLAIPAIAILKDLVETMCQPDLGARRLPEAMPTTGGSGGAVAEVRAAATEAVQIDDIAGVQDDGGRATSPPHTTEPETHAG